MQTFLWIDILLLLLPLAFSFHARIAIYKDVLFLLPAILISTLIFLLWDYFFSTWGIWNYNSEHLVGLFCFGLPIEVVLFYFGLSYCSLFIYATLKIIVNKDALHLVHKFINALILLFSLTIFFALTHKLYASMAALVSAYMLTCRVWVAHPKSLGFFYKAYLIGIVPYTLIIIILTNFYVINYNMDYVFGIRFFKMPLENLFYYFSLFFLNVGIYDWCKHKFGSQQLKPHQEITSSEVFAD